MGEFLGNAPVLVTGGAGYIGSLLVRRLMRLGRPVRVLDSLLYGDEAISELRGEPGFELVVGDFRDEATVADALRGIETVVHLGAIVGDPACALDEDFAIDTNFSATRTIVAACKAAGTQRFVFASTCSVYGASEGELNEESPLNPVSLYANTKIASERHILSERDDVFSPTILRFGTAYGASHRQRFDLVVNLLTAKAVMDGLITIHGGAQWRPFIHVDDIGGAIVCALMAPIVTVAGETFNVGSTEQNFQLGEVGSLIQEVVPESRVVLNQEITDRRNYFVNFEKAKSRLAFTPQRQMRESIEELAIAVRELGSYQRRIHNNHRFLLESDPSIRIVMGGSTANQFIV